MRFVPNCEEVAMRCFLDARYKQKQKSVSNKVPRFEKKLT